jgi:hypothetical protein
MNVAKTVFVNTLKLSSVAGGIYGLKNGYDMAKQVVHEDISTLPQHEKIGEYFCGGMIVVSSGLMGSLMTPTIVAFSPIIVPWCYYVWTQSVTKKESP